MALTVTPVKPRVFFRAGAGGVLIVSSNQKIKRVVVFLRVILWILTHPNHSPNGEYFRRFARPNRPANTYQQTLKYPDG
jgi:hypothetical protein